MFATLRGPLFAVGDEELLEWTHRFGSTTTDGFRRQRLHPFRVPAVFEGDVPEEVAHLRPVADALALLRQLHRRRNYVPVAQTLHQLLGATRAHVGFVLRTGGEQALANVLHVAELARQYEAGGGISFRGFVEELRDRGRHGRRGGGADPRGGQRRRPHDDRAQGQGARVSGRRSSPT